VEPVSDGGRRRAAFFGAHPDDVEIFALGTLLQLQSFGWDICWVIATDGSAANGERDPNLAAARRSEA